MQQQRIAFLGAGSMGQALIQGLLSSAYPAGLIVASEPNTNHREKLTKCGVKLAENNLSAIQQADLVIIATKPQQMNSVLSEIKPSVLRRRPLIVSIAAGIRTATIKKFLAADTPVVRCMPNTPALLRAGVSALYATGQVSADARQSTQAIFDAVGTSIWLEREELMDVVTALSGSGPAYFFYVMEILIQAATQLGLPPGQARQLCLQTARGAAKMALSSASELGELRQRVTSPGGTTEAALAVMAERGLPDLLSDALAAAYARSIDLAEKLGEQN